MSKIYAVQGDSLPLVTLTITAMSFSARVEAEALGARVQATSLSARPQ